jgi:hypothetical protein
MKSKLKPLWPWQVYEIIIFVEMLNSLVKFEEQNVVKENRLFFGIAKNLEIRRNK